MRAKKLGWSARDIIITALLGALMMVGQVALAFLPNIEVVSLFVILFTIVYRRRVVYMIYVFALLEGLIYGFTIWWTTYLYVWTILAAVTWLLRDMRSSLGWAVVSGMFGLCFGALCEIPFVITSGFKVAAAAWVTGIPFDLLHCIGNFALALLLFKPLYSILERFEKPIKR